MKKVASFLWMSTTFFWKSVRPYRGRGRWSLPQDAFAFGILYCNEISDSNWRWTDSIRFMLLYFQQPNFLYPAKSLLNFIENERFDVNHVIIFISRVNIIFQKKKRRLQLHNRIQFLSWTRIPSAHINLSSIPPLLININNLYWIDWELLSHRLAKNKIGRPSGSLTIPRSKYPSGPVCPYTDKIIVDRFTRPLACQFCIKTLVRL